MKKDLVSIIVPVYNASIFIKDTIDTVMKQTYQNFELIFVDDLSTDDSIKKIKSYKDKRIKIISLEEKGMAAGARNRGIEEAQGEYICYLDADDLWDKDKLLKQITFMKKHSCAFSFTGYEFTNELGIPTGKKVFIPSKLNYKQAIKNTTIFTSTVMFNMNYIKKEQIFMPNIKSEDTATWWSILKQGYQAYGLNEILVFYRRSANTLSSNKIEAIKRIWYLYRKYEMFNLPYSIICFICYAYHAVLRRV